MRRPATIAYLMPLECVSALAMFVSPLVSSGLVVAGLAFASRDLGLSPWWLLALSPVLYMVGLVLFLLTSTLEMWLLGLVYQTPEQRLELDDGRRALVKFVVMWYLYRRQLLVRSLPLINTLVMPPLIFRSLKGLIVRAYSPRVHLGKGNLAFIWLQDPALTYFGDNVVVGSGCDIVCHVFNVLPGGGMVYEAARVVIGSNVTLGGQSFIGMGARIGDAALVEAGSNVAPHTRIGPGEVWGGNPAVFLRHRDGSPAAPVVAPVGSANRAAVREIVARALRLAPGDVGADLSAATCAAWDSLAQMSIAAALFDRFGRRVPAARLFALQSLGAIEAWLGEEAAPVAVGSELEDAARADPELLPLLDPHAATRLLAARPPVGVALERRILIAATFTAQPLQAPLELWCRALGLAGSVELLAYDQVEQALLSPDSPFLGNAAGVNVVLARPEDLMGERDPAGRGRGERLLEAVAAFAARQPGLLVASLPPTLAPQSEAQAIASAALCAWWKAELATLSGVESVDFAGVVEALGREASRDAELEALTRAPYSAALGQRLAIAIARVVRARFVAPRKVLALDCDNLLWGGVVGEDGSDGLDLSAPFRALQEAVLELRQRGVLLVLVSRNEEQDVASVFESHPGMRLRPDDIAAARVNWQAKSANLAELARELKLGLDAFVFLDDSGVERREVRMNAPGVLVVPMPADPAAFAATLRRLWCFDGLGATREDASRTRLVAEEAERARRREGAGLEAFLASLGVEVVVRRAAPADLPRVAQLTQKTNQMNLSLVRRSLPEVQGLAPTRTILVLEAADQVGDYGLVAVAILERAHEDLRIETFLMSCRVLGRGVEEAFVAALLQFAGAEGCARVTAPYRSGPRNGQARVLFRAAGFEGEDEALSRSVVGAPAAPGHVRLRTDFAIAS